MQAFPGGRSWKWGIHPEARRDRLSWQYVVDDLELVPGAVGPQEAARAEALRYLGISETDRPLELNSKPGRELLEEPPRRILVLTGKESDAQADVTGTLRFPAEQVSLLHVPMTGMLTELVEVLNGLTRADADIVVIARGGGDPASMVGFDHRGIAQAIRECAVPVVTGIGHRKNVSAADLAARASYATPSAAAAAVNGCRFAGEPDLREKDRRIRQLGGELRRAKDECQRKEAVIQRALVERTSAQGAAEDLERALTRERIAAQAARRDLQSAQAALARTEWLGNQLQQTTAEREHLVAAAASRASSRRALGMATVLLALAFIVAAQVQEQHGWHRQGTWVVVTSLLIGAMVAMVRSWFPALGRR